MLSLILSVFFFLYVVQSKIKHESINIDTTTLPIIEFNAFNQYYKVKLIKNDKLYERCHYDGSVLNTDQYSIVSVSLCPGGMKDTIRGSITAFNETLIINPSLVNDFNVEIYRFSDVAAANKNLKSKNRRASGPVPLIIDTDLGFDVDDAGAVAVGNHLQDIGACKLLGVVHNTGFYYGIGGVDVINHYYGRSNISALPLGAYTGPWGSSSQSQQNQNKYTTTIEHNYPSPVQNYNQTPSAVDAYTTMLQSAEDNSVVIASIGELTNLRDIIKANKDLFIQKVAEIYYMDGSYNFGCGDSDGSGWSPYMGSTDDCYGAAQYVIQNVPKSIKQVFTLNGGNVLTGGRFNNGCGQGPVKEAYQIWTNHGTRPSWDPICVYLAVMGDTSLYSSLLPGTDSVDYYGNEHFDTSNTGNNQYQVWIDGNHDGDVTRIIDNQLCAAPCKSIYTDFPVGACGTYKMNSMKNCYDGHGATNLEHPTDSSAGTMSLYDCQQLCDNTAQCDGVTVSNNETITGYINCYRKANINLGECDDYIPYDTWTKIN